MNEAPPYEILPEDLTLDMLKRNSRPSFATLQSGVAAGRIIELHDPKHFDQDMLRPLMEVDELALKRGLLKAPAFYFNLDVLDVVSRTLDMMLRDEEIREAITSDHPDFNYDEPAAKDMLQLRGILLCQFIRSALAMANHYTTGFAKERIKHGLEPDLYSMVSVLPDVKGFDQKVLSLVNLYLIEDEACNSHCYIDLFRP